MVETQGLILKHHVEQVLNDALKDLRISAVDSSSKEDILEEQQLPIDDDVYNQKIKIRISYTNLRIARKYFAIWKTKCFKVEHRTQDVKKSEINEKQINKFIENLKIQQGQKKNKKLETKTARSKSADENDRHHVNQTQTQCKSSDSEVFENRYKAQRDIILMQKSKLLEQEKIIQELQFGKISEELQVSYEDSQAHIKKLLKKLSTRTKILTGVRIAEEPDEIQMKINRVPKMVRQMEQRAKERELKRQIIQERKRLIDEERKRLLQMHLENKRIQDEEDKKRNLEAIKERRRKEIEEDKRKQMEKANYVAKCKMADQFYSKALKKRSMEGFKSMIENKEFNENISTAFYEMQMMRKVFYQWKQKTEEASKEKNDKATTFYKDKIKKKYFRGFVMIRVKAEQNMQVAVDYYNYQIQCKMFKKLYLLVNAIRIRRYHMTRLAARQYDSHLLVKSFYQWKSLPAVLQLERAKEEKKRKWREKILEIVPDYCPPPPE